MVVCADCKKEMRCEHTGTAIRFGPAGDHVYAGDTFKCPSCGKQTVVCNKNPYNANSIILEPTDIIMEEITDASKIKPRHINLRNIKDGTIRERDIHPIQDYTAGDDTIKDILKNITKTRVHPRLVNGYIDW
jgi:hypothetical protein